MGVLLEKLTGTSSKQGGGEMVSASSPRAAAGRASGQETPILPAPTAAGRTTRLKVAAPELEVVPQEIQPLNAEEEGELTVDIYDSGDAIVIQSTVAGVKPEDLDVSITSDSVTIRGRRERQESVAEENYYYKELFWGTFSRSVILPEEIEDAMAEAALKYGLLSIRLPKKRKGVVQKLKVKLT